MVQGVKCSKVQKFKKFKGVNFLTCHKKKNHQPFDQWFSEVLFSLNQFFTRST